MPKLNQEKQYRVSPTYVKILEAARKEFVLKGFDGSSISDIAQGARINQSLIYHHFGSKYALWQSVQEHILEKYQKLDKKLLVHCESLEVFLQNLVQQRFTFYEKYPDVLRIMNWQTLKGQQSGLSAESLDAWHSAITKLQENGEIRPYLDPKYVVGFISSTITGAFTYGSHLFPQPKKSKVQRLEYMETIIECLQRGLQV